MKDQLFLFSSWGGARYLDWWVVVHILGAMAATYLLLSFNMDSYKVIFTLSIIIIGWEIFEKLANINEPYSNTSIDIIVGYLGVWLAYQIPYLTFNARVVVIALLFASWAFLGIWGWLAWNARQTKLQTSKVRNLRN